MRYLLSVSIVLMTLIFCQPVLAINLLNLPVANTEAPIAKTEPPVVFPGVAEVVSRLANLNSFFDNTQIQLENMANVERHRLSLDKILVRQESFEKRVEELGDPDSGSFERLLENKHVLAIQNDSLGMIFSSLTDQLSKIEGVRVLWQQKKKFWLDWQEYLVSQGVEIPSQEFELALQQLDTILKKVNEASGPLISIQQEVRGVQDRNQIAARQIANGLKSLRGKIFNKSDLSFFHQGYYSQFNPELKAQFDSNLDLVEWYRNNYLKDYWWVLLLQFSISVALAISLRNHRSKNNDSSQWNVLFRHPWASGLFVSFAILSPLYKAPPLTWTFYILVISVVSVSILISEIVIVRRHKLLVRLLATVYLSSVFFKVIALPLPIYRLYMVALSVIGIPLLAWMVVLGRRSGDAWQFILGLRCGIVLLLISLVAQLGGFSTLSFQLIDSSIKTVFLVLMILMIDRLARGGIAYSLSHRKSRSWRFIRLFGDSLGMRLSHMLLAVVYSYGLLYLIQIWGGSNTFAGTWEKLKELGFSVAGLPLTMGTLIMVIVVMYLSSTLSWLLRSALDVEIVGPRYMDSGVRDSIKTLMHYLIISCGILFALGAAGIGLQNFAVIAGALSIGIGFGLQNIVNNFISGLILLFERPVKIGDRIVLDNEWAIVRKIGLRSTVIETYNQAEIIVPNSQLISEQVTNLTLTNTRTRIVLKISVAYGEDMDRVLNIFNVEAAKHPLVLSYPEPSPVFVGFGESSLDFQLRAWLADFDQSVGVKSELGVAIYKRFNEEGITIPVPQRGLHVNSVADAVMKGCSGSFCQASEPTLPVEEGQHTKSDDQGDAAEQ